jgi:hypothetical protein
MHGASGVWHGWVAQCWPIANAVTRELAYKDRVGDLTAHQISTASSIVLLFLYFWLLDRRSPIPTVGLPSGLVLHGSYSPFFLSLSLGTMWMASHGQNCCRTTTC